MTLSEFKAWFDGYTEDMKDTPSKKQWERIKARVSEIDGSPITPIVYVDRYVRPYWRDYYGPYWGNAQTAAAGLCHPSEAASVLGAGNSSTMAGPIVQDAVDRFPAKEAAAQFDGRAAMYAAGKVEALVA